MTGRQHIASLTMRTGPHTGATVVWCTCGWERHYKSVIGAKRGIRAHAALCDPEATSGGWATARTEWGAP